MTVLGLVMASIYGFIVAVPFPRARAAVASGAWETAGPALIQVRRLVGVNLVLGLVTLTVADPRPRRRLAAISGPTR